MSEETSRGWIHVGIIFDVSARDEPYEIANTIQKYVLERLESKNYPYEKMKLVHVEMEGSDLDYRDWDYEDRINYLEDCRERE